MRDAAGSVHLRGQVKQAAMKGQGTRKLPLVVFTLPEDYRPRYRRRVPILSRGKVGILDVLVSGEVLLVKGGVEELSLDGLILAADA